MAYGCSPLFQEIAFRFHGMTVRNDALGGKQPLARSQKAERHNASRP